MTSCGLISNHPRIIFSLKKARIEKRDGKFMKGIHLIPITIYFKIKIVQSESKLHCSFHRHLRDFPCTSSFDTHMDLFAGVAPFFYKNSRSNGDRIETISS